MEAGETKAITRVTTTKDTTAMAGTVDMPATVVMEDTGATITKDMEAVDGDMIKATTKAMVSVNIGIFIFSWDVVSNCHSCQVLFLCPCHTHEHFNGIYQSKHVLAYRKLFSMI